MTNPNESLVGKSVWIEMDVDKSGTIFSPRKGIIVHVFEHPPEKEAIAVELVPSHLAFFPYPHRISHIVLQYFNHDQQAIRETFRSGFSYAEILRLRNKKALKLED